ncbi:hypothetical protein ACF0H5_001119 [Mactra antiquata]
MALSLIGIGKRICCRTLFQTQKCLRVISGSSMSTVDNKPRQPPTVFVSYFKSLYPTLRANNPDKPVYALAKIASDMYKALSEEELKSLKDERAKAYEDYKKRYEFWMESLTEDEKENLVTEKAEKKIEKKKRKVKSLQKENNMPKKPISSFNLYFTEHLKASNLQFTPPEQRMTRIREIMKECAEKWKTLPESDKMLFKEKADEELALYESQMRLWEAEMIKAGKLNLIRKSTLKEELNEKKTNKVMKKKIKAVKKQDSSVENNKTLKSALKKEGTSKKSKKKVTFEDYSSDSD